MQHACGRALDSPPEEACRRHRCRSTPNLQGRALLRQWCLAPVADAEVLRGRHDAIDTLMAAPDLAASVLVALKKVG